MRTSERRTDDIHLARAPRARIANGLSAAFQLPQIFAGSGLRDEMDLAGSRGPGFLFGGAITRSGLACLICFAVLFAARLVLSRLRLPHAIAGASLSIDRTRAVAPAVSRIIRRPVTRALAKT